MELPQQFLDNMHAILGEDYNKYIDAMGKPAVSGVRINLCKVSEDDKQKISTEIGAVKMVDYTKNGYVIASSKIGKHPYHKAGLVYVQEPSSMLPVAASGLEDEPSKDLCVLDLCAAPGGKSGQIAEILNGNGVLVSNEIDLARAKILGGNIERMGYSNVIITCASPQLLAKNLPQMFDYVFVDAPCGGEGMFRKDPDTIGEWKQERLESNAERQKQIVAEADKMLKNGGKLVYSTCTFAVAEDEDVANWIVDNLGYKFCQIPEPIKNATTSFSSEFCRRYYPYLGAGEGQFICVLQKQNAETLEQNERPQKLINLSKNEQKLTNDWLLDNFCIDFAVNYTKVGEYICTIDQKLQNVLKFMQKVPQINAGIRLGNIEKGRFVPHNNAFVALGNWAKNKFNFALGDLSIAKYLHGEQLQNTSKNTTGYGVVCVDNYPLGGVRISGSALKNLLPKGLRI